ncbi:MAG: AI-2E family transporter [Paludibacteraceae bacterium]|nr:AI-2E family transporter [Paludibacteraceae bacterium]
MSSSLRPKEYNLDTITRGVITILVILALYFLTRRLSSVLLPFLISWIIAYMLNPLVNFLQYKCRLKSRGLSIFAAILLVIGVIAAIIALIVPMISREMAVLSDYISYYMATVDSNKVLAFLPPEMQQSYLELVENMDISRLMQDERFIAFMQKLMPKLWEFLSGSVSAIMGLAVVFICVLYVIFILLDYESLTSSWSSFIPVKYRRGAENLMSDLESGMNSYFRGQAMVASIVGILFALGFEIIGLPLGILVGLFIGVLNMVPYLQVIGIIPCAILGILQSAETGRPIWLVFTLIAVVFIVVQTIQDMVLTPKIMGGVTGLHPAIILLALSIWGSLLGIVGMIIALPMTTLMISYYKRFIIGDEEFVTSIDDTSE